MTVTEQSLQASLLDLLRQTGDNRNLWVNATGEGFGLAALLTHHQIPFQKITLLGQAGQLRAYSDGLSLRLVGKGSGGQLLLEALPR